MNAYLETAIAVVLIILAFSVIIYIVQELIAANLRLRGKMLQNSLKQLLDSNTGQTLTNQIYNHPQVKKLQKNLQRLPSYISAENFTTAVIDLVSGKAPAAGQDVYVNFINGLPAYAANSAELKSLLESLVKVSANLEKLKENIQKYYNDYMDRVTGWYKDQSAVITRILAAIVVLLFNFNLIQIIITVNNDPDLKAKLNMTAAAVVANQDNYKALFKNNIDTRLKEIGDSSKQGLGDPAKQAAEKADLSKLRDSVINNYTRDRTAEIKEIYKSVDDEKLRFGYKYLLEDLGDSKNLVLNLLGLFIGYMALTVGAPFWFDVLIKLVNVRKSGLKPEGNK